MLLKVAIGLVFAAIPVVIGIGLLVLFHDPEQDDLPAEASETSPSGMNDDSDPAESSEDDGGSTEGSDDDGGSTESSDDDGGSTEGSDDDSGSADPTPPSNADDCIEWIGDNLVADTAELIRVSFEVLGFGPDGNWVWEADPACAAGHDPLAFYGNAGECTLLSTGLAEFLVVTLIANPEVLDPEFFSDAHFSAGVRVSQREFISLGWNEAFDVTTGGLSFGAGQGELEGDGRDLGEQWTFNGGSFEFDGSDGASDVGVGVRMFEATWTGLAIDDAAGPDDVGQTNGTVRLTCEFVYL